MFPIDVSINGPPNEDIVFGFPGIAASWPRLEGSVEIRSKDGSLQKISLVSIALYRTDTIHAPSSKPGINAPKKEQSFLIGQEQSLFQTSAGRASENVVAMDLPFIYEMPTNRPLPASISMGKNSVETTYKIFVTVTYGSNQIMHTSHPIRIKRYDTLSTFGSFKVPVVKNVQSADHLVDLDYTYPVSSFGPLDPVQVYIKVAANPDIGSKSKKVKLVKVSIQIVEVITYNPEGDEPVEKRRKVVKSTKQVDQKLSRDFKFELSMDYPQYEPKDKDSIVAKERQDVPTIAMSGFTAKSSLYKVEYLLVIKAKFSGAKDIESEERITVSPFGHATCMSFMASIGKCVEQAKRVDKSSKPPSTEEKIESALKSSDPESVIKTADTKPITEVAESKPIIDSAASESTRETPLELEEDVESEEIDMSPITPTFQVTRRFPLVVYLDQLNDTHNLGSSGLTQLLSQPRTVLPCLPL